MYGKLFVAANSYVGARRKTKCLACVTVMSWKQRERNPSFKKAVFLSGTITITDRRMTRFWITLNQGIEFVVNCMEKNGWGRGICAEMQKYEDSGQAKEMAMDCKIKYLGIRPGGKDP